MATEQNIIGLLGECRKNFPYYSMDGRGMHEKNRDGAFPFTCGTSEKKTKKNPQRREARQGFYENLEKARLILFDKSLYFLLKFVKDWGGEKFAERDIQTVTEFFDGGNGDFTALWVEHTVHRRRRYSGKNRQFVDSDIALETEFTKALCNCVFNHHHVHHL